MAEQVSPLGPSWMPGRHGRADGDPIRKRYDAVEIVRRHFFDPEGSRMHG